ncbi:MAG: polysaccharide deacetylase family protein [Nitrospirae bacterium]|nr:polysaccharide deacetylase family protein [Nitrospirota bacterium]
MRHNSIPVVMYHHIAPTDRDLNVYPEIFEDHLRALGRKGWKTLFADEFVHFLHNQNDKPKKCVLLTFDDGFADNYVYAYPLLEKFKMKAVIFVATDFIEDADIDRSSFVPLSHKLAWKLAHTERRSEVMCTWKELKELEASGAVDIQSHGMSHKSWQYMKDKNYAGLKEDISGSKAIIEEKLSKAVNHLCWPRGYFDEEGIRAACSAGYKALYTIERGCNTVDDLTKVSRLPVRNNKSGWLMRNLGIYSSVLLTKLYLAVRTG